MTNSNFLDDIAKFGNTALNEADRMQRQVRKWAGDQVDYVVESMDLVHQEEFDAYKAETEKRIAALEKLVGTKAKKTASKKAAPKKKAVAKKKPTAKKAE